MHRYTIGRTLGEGAFGQVKQALHTESGEKVSKISHFLVNSSL